MMKMLSGFRKSEKGQSVVEFALILPLLLVILLGIIEFGWFLNAKISITNAAREGVRVYAITNSVPDAQNAALNSLQNKSITGKFADPKPHVDPTITDPDIKMVKVIVKGDVQGLTGGAFTGLVKLLTGSNTGQYNTIPMESTAIMRLEK